jgi:hypothetical protein
MYGHEEFPVDYGDDVGPSTPVGKAAEASSSTPEIKIVKSDQKTETGQTVLTGEFQMKEWFGGPGTRVVDGQNAKGYPRSLIKIGIAKPDQCLIKTRKNPVKDAVPPEYHMKGVDTFGSHASLAEYAYVREIGSIGHVRCLTEGGGLAKAYPVCC